MCLYIERYAIWVLHAVRFAVTWWGHFIMHAMFSLFLSLSLSLWLCLSCWLSLAFPLFLFKCVCVYWLVYPGIVSSLSTWCASHSCLLLLLLLLFLLLLLCCCCCCYIVVVLLLCCCRTPLYALHFNSCFLFSICAGCYSSRTTDSDSGSDSEGLQCQ